VNRKNTILLAVLINAGLLVVLFVTALTSQEELSMPPTHEMSAIPKHDLDSPLFGDELDLAMRQPTTSLPAELPQVIFEKPQQVQTAASLHVLPPAAVAAPTPSVELASAPFSPISPVKPTAVEVIVKKGDTLEKIAKLQKTTVDEIIKTNHLPSSFLRVGQALKMPAEKAVKTQVASNKAVESQGSDYYTVKVGDNPWTIAMKNHIKVDQLLKMNALNDEKARKLKAGDRLRIR
jgi:peptidoglycan endopeptidase LytF